MNVASTQLLLLALVGGCGDRVSQAAPPQAFSITIRSPARTWKVGSDLTITIRLENVSGQKLLLRKAPGQEQGELFMDVDVEDEHGHPPPRTKYFRVLRGIGGDDPARGPNEELLQAGSIQKKVLGPGESLTDGIVVSKLFDLSRPGNYTIRVRRHDQGSDTIVVSNTIAVTVSD
jgi:hypothetical protein